MTKRFLIFFAAFALTAIQADAGTYTSQTLDFSVTPNISGFLTFNKFSPSLGNLTSIEISFTLNATGGYLKLDNGGTENIDGTFNFGVSGVLSSADVELKNSSSEFIPSQVDTYHGQSFHLGPAPDELLYNGSNETAASSGFAGNTFWSGFIGSNTYNIYYSVTQIASCLSSGSDKIALSSSPPTADGFVTVTYSYDAIPEPATFAILGLGMTSIFRKTPIAKQKI